MWQKYVIEWWKQQASLSGKDNKPGGIYRREQSMKAAKKEAPVLVSDKWKLKASPLPHLQEA